MLKRAAFVALILGTLAATIYVKNRPSSLKCLYNIEDVHTHEK